MHSIPVHPEPNVHSGTHSGVAGDSGEQHVTAAPTLSNSGNAVILRMQPSKHRANKPFTVHILRFVRPVRKPKARFEVISQTSCLCALRAQERMEVLIRYQA